jgi:3-dehydroquinate synthetase
LIKKYDYKSLITFDTNKIIKVISTDKKATDNHIQFIFPSAYAQVEEYSFTIDEITEFLNGSK